MVEAVILAGGLGTRLASAVPGLPKALAPIRGVAFLDLMLKQLAQSKMVSKAVLAIGFRSEAIVRHFEEREAPLPLGFSIESKPLGTGGALLHALPQTTGETLLVLNGDCFCDLSYADFYAYHQSKSADLTLAVLHLEDRSRYGSVQFGGDGRIREFKEKSPEKKEGYVNIGIYLAQREAFAAFAQEPCSIEIDLFPRMVAKQTFAFTHEGTFLDIGTPHSYEVAQRWMV